MFVFRIVKKINVCSLWVVAQALEVEEDFDSKGQRLGSALSTSQC